MHDKLLSIQEVADVLGVSTKTLRRWDKRGILVPQRTFGNQRRYTREQIAVFRKPKFAPIPIQEEVLPPALRPQLYKQEVSALSNVETSRAQSNAEWKEVRVKRFTLGSLVVILGIFGILLFTHSDLPERVTKMATEAQKKLSGLVEFRIKPQDLVLAETTFNPQLKLNVNVPATFLENVGIGTATPDPSAVLDLTSTSSGFLAPRMTTAQRDAIDSPATSLFIYNTTTNEYNMYDGTNWVPIATGDTVGSITAVGDVTSGDAFTATGSAGTSLYFYDTDGRGKLTIANLSAARTYTLPDATGNVITTGNLTEITKVGTITSGTWNGTKIGTGYGGTNADLSAAVQGSVPYFSSTGTMAALAPSTSGYILSTNGSSANPSWIDPATISSSQFDRASGAIFPKISTLDLLVGGTTTASAKFGFINVDSGTPTATISAGSAGGAYLTATGNLQTTANQQLILGGSTTGNVVIDSGNSVVRVADLTTNGAVYVSGSNGTLNSEATLDETRGGTGLDTSGVTDGQLLIGNDSANGFTLAALTEGSGITITNAAGAITIAQTGGGASKWTQANGLLRPNQATVLDLILGGDATASAKFGFINVNSGTPTASISANSGNNATILTGAGNLGTVNQGTLTLGGSTTGDILIQPNSDTGDYFKFQSDATNLTLSTTDGSNLTITPAGTFNAFSTGDATIDATTDIVLDADGADVILKDAGTTFTTFTNSSTDLTITVAGGNILTSSALNLGGAAAANYNYFASDISGNSTPDGVADLYIQDELEVDGTVRFNNLTYTFPSTETANYLLQTNGTGTLTWTDLAVHPGNFWRQTSGALYPGNSTVDVLVGANSTASAKFGFINVNSGTPTASISANSGNNAAFLTGGGNLGTTNAQTLTLGGSSTGNIIIDSGSSSISFSDAITLGSDTVSDFTGNGLTTSSNALTINVTTSGTTGATSSNSGLEVLAGGLTLLKGCAADELLTWDETSSVWKCNTASGIGAGGDITAVGSMTSGVAFGDSTADDDWLGLGAAAGRIEFDDQAVDEVNILQAAVGLGTSTPIANLHIDGTYGGNATVIVNQTGTATNDLLTASASGTTKFTVTNGGNLRLAESNGAFFGIVTVGDLSENETYNLPAISGASSADFCLTSGNCAGVGGVGDIQTVGSMTSGDVFADSTADDDWLGLGAAAGRIEFDDQTVDEVNILQAAVGIGTSTPVANLHISGVYGGNAALIVNQTGAASNDIIVASASGTTRFTLANDGDITLSGGDTITATSLTLFTGGATAIDFTEFDVSGSTGSITINDGGDAGNISIEGTVLDINSLDFVAGGTITSGGSNTLTLDAGSNVITFAASDTTLTASGLATITSAATLGVSATTLNLGGGSAATIGTISDDSLTLTANGSGNIILTGDFDSQVLVGATGATTEFPLLVRSGIGSNATVAIDQLNTADILTASASGTTRFTLANDGDVTLAGGDTITATSLVLFTGGATAIDFTEFDVSASTGSITINDGGDAGNISIEGTTLDINSLDFTGAGTITSGGSNTLTLDSGNNVITFAADDATLTASGLATITSAATLGISATTLNLGAGSAATIGTVSNDNLTLTPNGTGNIILTGDFDSEVLIGATGATTEFPLLVRSGIGSNASLAVDQLNSGDIITASASGTTRFTLANDGDVTLSGGDTITATSLTTFTGGATAIDFTEFDVSGSTGSITINDGGDAGNISIEGTVLDINSLDFTGAGSITSGGSNTITLDAGSNVITFAASDTTLTASGLATITSAATLGISATALNLGGGSAATLSTVSDDNLTFTAQGTGDLIITTDADTNLQLSASGFADCAVLTTVSNVVTCGAGGSTNWDTVNGTILPKITSQDFLLGGRASSSATFRVTGNSPFQGTDSVASIAAKTSFATLVVDNFGSGDILAASTSGLTRFVVRQNGNVGIGTNIPKEKFVVNGGVILNTPTGTESGNLEVLGGINLAESEGKVVVSGKYAYTVNKNDAGFRIIDVADPTAPVVVKAVDTATVNTRGIAVVGRYAYIVLDSVAGDCNLTTPTGCEFRIYDISEPNDPKYLSGLALNSDITAVYAVGKYVYIGGTSGLVNELRIYDVSDPFNPRSTYELETGRSINALYVSGKYLYVGDGTVARIYDITNPSSATWTGGSITLNTNALYVSGKYLYLASGAIRSGTCSGTTLTGCEFLIYDISNPVVPATVGGWDTTFPTLGMAIGGKYAYLGLYDALTDDDLVVLDISTPGYPKFAGGLEIVNTDNKGIRSLFISGKYLYMTVDDPGGSTNEFRIIDIVGLDTPSIIAGSILSGSLSVSDDARVDGTLYVQSGLSVGNNGLSVFGLSSFYSSHSGTLATIDARTNSGTAPVASFSATTANAMVVLDNSGIGDIFTASSSGNVQFTIQNNGAIDIAPPPTANTAGLCWDNSGRSLIYDCSSAPGDLAEYFGTSDPSIEAGDVVAIDPTRQAEEVVNVDDVGNVTTTSKAWILKANKPYDKNILGVISTSPNEVYADDGVFEESDNPRPVALVGRVPVKVSSENGPINIGDPITASSVPGIGMKATQGGYVVGRALSSFEGEGIGEILIFVNAGVHEGLLERFEITQNDIVLNLTSDGNFVIKDEEGNDVIKFDSEGNAFFAGTITTDRIKANQVEGLEFLLSMASESSDLATPSGLLANAESLGSLNVTGSATVSGKLTADSLTVKNSSLIEGVLSVIDTITSPRIIITDLANFIGSAVFKNDVKFEKAPVFPASTAGTATVETGDREVVVTFEKEYENAPVVTAALALGAAETPEEQATIDNILTTHPAYSVVSVSKTGFKIRLADSFTDDLKFSWVAVAVAEQIGSN